MNTVDLYLVDLLGQAVEEYNEVQKDESKHLDWWEVVGSIDADSESEIKDKIAEIQSQTLAIEIKERMSERSGNKVALIEDIEQHIQKIKNGGNGLEKGSAEQRLIAAILACYVEELQEIIEKHK